MWSRNLLLAKLKAWGIHLGISALIFLPLLWLLLFRWFPAPLFVTDGGWQGLRIMLGVDMVLGPLLTLMIFNPAKSRRETLFDFSCIGLIQAVALCFGAYSIEQKRPWTLAWYEGAFSAIARDVYREQSGVTPEAWQRFGESPIYRVYVRKPQTAEEQSGAAAYEVMESISPAGLFFLYEPFEAHWNTMRSQALDMNMLTVKDDGLRARLTALQEKHAGQNLLFFAHNGYFRSAYVALDQTGRYLDAIYVDTPKP